jgi:hypothetical protein
MTVITRVPYTYRDASNYRSETTVELVGRITYGHVARLAQAMDPEGFLPEQLGLPHAAAEDPTMVNFPSIDNDHPWHEIAWDDIEVVTVTGPEQPQWHWEVETFVSNMEAQSRAGWRSHEFTGGI